MVNSVKIDQKGQENEESGAWRPSEEDRLSSSNVFYPIRAFLIAQSVKNLPAMQEAPVRFLGLEDPLEKG